MIAPHMATMLAFIGTDAAVSRAYLHRATPDGVDDSFNMIVIDGDMSTNDTTTLANGAVPGGEGGPGRLPARCDAFQQAGPQRLRLAQGMPRDGEGACKFIERYARRRPPAGGRHAGGPPAIAGSNRSRPPSPRRRPQPGADSLRRGVLRR